jgi:hypothetical protein
MQGHYHGVTTGGNVLSLNDSIANGVAAGVAPTYGAGASALTQATAPTTGGTNGTPRISSETRPVNVAVTFCQFNGTSNGWNNPIGGSVTPAGATNDVQFNSAGSLAADTGNFTYTSGILKVKGISVTTNQTSVTHHQPDQRHQPLCQRRCWDWDGEPQRQAGGYRGHQRCAWH